MSVVTVCNHKGGTGKTTTSIHLAAAFGRQGRRVLVVDLDPQGFLTRMLGASEPPPEHSALGLLAADADLRTFPVQSVSGFDLIGSSMALTKALRRLTKPTDVLWLRETIRAGHDYDVILLDTAAALSPYTMNALVASDQIVIPVTPEYQPVVGAEQTWQTSGLVKDKLNPVLSTPRFLLTQVDARLSRHARYATYLREKYRDAVLSTAIRTSSSLAVASRDGRTVFDAPRMTRGAVDYTAAADELARIIFGGATSPVTQPTSGPEAVPAETSAPAPSTPAAPARESPSPQGATPAPLRPLSSGGGIQPPRPAPPTLAPAPAAQAPTPIQRAPLPGDPPRPDGTASTGWTPLDRL